MVPVKISKDKAVHPWVLPPRTGIKYDCPIPTSTMVALTEERQMTQMHSLAIDLAKKSFNVCPWDCGGTVSSAKCFHRLDCSSF
jgi:hypothetical protein